MTAMVALVAVEAAFASFARMRSNSLPLPLQAREYVRRAAGQEMGQLCIVSLHPPSAAANQRRKQRLWQNREQRLWRWSTPLQTAIVHAFGEWSPEGSMARSPLGSRTLDRAAMVNQK
eukprot:1235407-Pleurochrysis_carterae.AAC.1